MLIMSLLVKFVKILILVKQGCQFKLDSAALANKIWNGKFLQKFRDIQFMLLLLDSIFPNQLMQWEYPPPALFSFSHWHNCTFREIKRKKLYFSHWHNQSRIFMICMRYTYGGGPKSRFKDDSCKKA